MNLYIFEVRYTNKQINKVLKEKFLFFVINDYLNKNIKKMLLYTDENGNKKINAEGKEFYYSVSYSKKYMICGINDDVIGVDIEYKDPKYLSSILTILNKEELNNISLNNINEYYKYWCLKEAYSKFLGKGFLLDFKKFEFHLNDEIIVFNEYTNTFERGFTLINNIENYQIAICKKDDSNICTKYYFVHFI